MRDAHVSWQSSFSLPLSHTALRRYMTPQQEQAMRERVRHSGDGGPAAFHHRLAAKLSSTESGHDSTHLTAVVQQSRKFGQLANDRHWKTVRTSIVPVENDGIVTPHPVEPYRRLRGAPPASSARCSGNHGSILAWPESQAPEQNPWPESGVAMPRADPSALKPRGGLTNKIGQRVVAFAGAAQVEEVIERTRRRKSADSVSSAMDMDCAASGRTGRSWRPGARACGRSSEDPLADPPSLPPAGVVVAGELGRTARALGTPLGRRRAVSFRRGSDGASTHR